MRQEIPIIVLGADGRPAAGASVYVRTDPGGADATIYQARTGGATHPNPRVSDAQGRVAGWLERGDYAATITVAGLDPWVEPFPIASANDGHLDLAEAPDGLWTSIKLTPNLRPSSLYRLGNHSARPAATAVEAGTVWRSIDKWMEWTSDGATWTLISAEPQPLAAVPADAPAAPASAPVDGQRISLPLGKGRVVFRYNSATGGAYKWEAEGTPAPFVDYLAAVATLTSAAYADPTAGGVGPSLTLPYSGDWLLQVGATMAAPAAGQTAYISYTVGAAAPVDADGAWQGSQSTAGSGNYYSLASAPRDKTAIAAATLIRAKYKATSGQGSWQNRWLQAVPERVGP